MGGALLEGLVDGGAECTLQVGAEGSFEGGLPLLSVHASLL